MDEPTHAEKRKELEAAGWKFLRRDSRGKWVRVGNSKRIERMIRYYYEKEKQCAVAS